jgi:hypothetical protein
VRGVLLALAVLVSAPFVRRFGHVDTVALTWSETRRFAEELRADEAFERAIFVKEVVIALGITSLIVARLILV